MKKLAVIVLGLISTSAILFSVWVIRDNLKLSKKIKAKRNEN